MSAITPELVFHAVELFGGAAGAVWLRRVTGASAQDGGKRGAENALNGKGDAIGRIEELINTVRDSQVKNAESTAHEFTAIRSDISNTRERVATMEGALEQLIPPKRIKRRV